jgi:hypothetical protein
VFTAVVVPNSLYSKRREEETKFIVTRPKIDTYTKQRLERRKKDIYKTSM